MSFQKRRVKSSTYKKKLYKKKKTLEKNKKKRIIVWKTLLWFFLFFLILLVLGFFILYKKYIEPLPDINELEQQEIAEASIIYDRDGNELYKIFEEKRTYKNFDQINENMINALVAWEDKRYWENPGIDFIGLVRAVIYRVTGRSDKLEWTSTLTQQLIRNMIITNERTAERKIKEMYLAYKLTKNLSKEKIIELYLNKIGFWSNAFGIEQAAQTFFGVKASDLWILESSILASLPKGPSYYSPYNNYNRLVWNTYVYNNADEESITNIITPTQIEENALAVTEIKDFISQLKLQRYTESTALICGLEREKLKSFISVDGEWCSVIDYSDLLILLNGIKIWYEEENFVEYQTWRKDFILGRMLEDDYISFDEYKESLLTSIGFEFESYTEEIKHPHFVFYVREYLEEKYGKEILEKGWLRIYTSLNPDLQKKAEEIVLAQANSNTAAYGASNSALISIDNKTGEVLAMVWWKDYFDEENKGNINMVTAQLQPGSTFKPFVYSMAIDQEIIGTKTPIYDLKTTFPGWYAPNNFDGEFRWKMDISTALNESRNIPAVKMFFLAWGEEKILEWMDSLWATTIRDFKNSVNEQNGNNAYSYGASMALWTGMMTPLELAEAYSVYANMWYKKETVPVLKIYDSKWLTIEEFDPTSNTWEEVIDPATAYITNYILSDTSTRPSYWNNFLSLSGRQAAAKTWTSTKQFEQNGEQIIYPRNLWTVWYTPDVTTVVWSWNNSWAETNLKWNGLEASWPIWKDFMEYYHQNKPALEWKQPSSVKERNISDLSWLLAPEWLSSDLIVRSLFVNAPVAYDSSGDSVEVDLLCNGLIDESTPESAKGFVSLLRLRSLQPNNPAWENPVQAWAQAGWYLTEWNYVTSIKNTACERVWLTQNIEIWASFENSSELLVGSNYIQIWYDSPSPLQKIDIIIDGEVIQTISLTWETQWIYAWNVSIPSSLAWEKNIIFRALDTEYYSAQKSYGVTINSKDSTSPTVQIDNPSSGSIQLLPWDSFSLQGSVSDQSSIRSINIYIDETPYKIGLEGRTFNHLISTEGLSIWDHVIKVESIDMAFNKWHTNVVLTILWNESEEAENENNTPEDENNILEVPLNEEIWEEPEL